MISLSWENYIKNTNDIAHPLSASLGATFQVQTLTFAWALLSLLRFLLVQVQPNPSLSGRERLARSPISAPGPAEMTKAVSVAPAKAPNFPFRKTFGASVRQDMTKIVTITRPKTWHGHRLGAKLPDYCELNKVSCHRKYRRRFLAGRSGPNVSSPPN